MYTIEQAIERADQIVENIRRNQRLIQEFADLGLPDNWHVGVYRVALDLRSGGSLEEVLSKLPAGWEPDGTATLFEDGTYGIYWRRSDSAGFGVYVDELPAGFREEE